MKKISKKFILYGVVIIFLLTMSFVSTIFAKYVSNVESGSLIKPNAFYFNTNYEDKQFYELYSDEIVITVSNSYLDYVTQEDVEYSLVVKEEGNIIIAQSGTLTKSITSKTHTLDVEFDKEYTVVITSTAPFVKQIEYSFKTYASYVDSYYTLTDMGGWIELDLYIGTTVPNSIIVNYISALSADNTNPLTKDWYGTQGIISNSLIINNAHYKLIFFKNDSYTYSNITEGTFTINSSNYTVNITK